MLAQPKVSIGLPVYNGETFLRDSLDSMLNQTFKDFELIIVDNASTDKTESICRNYAARDNRIRYYRNLENLGAAPNFNRAFHLAKGEYFKWVAVDDVCDPTFLECCIEEMDRDPSIVLVYTQTVFTKPDGSKWWTSELLSDLDSEILHQRFRAAITNFWCVEVFGLIRRDVLAQTSLIASYYGSDKLLLAELSLLGPFKAIPKPLFFRRCHANQSSRLSSEERKAWIDSKSSNKWLGPRNSTGLLMAVLRFPIGWQERFRCLNSLRKELINKLPQILAYRFQNRIPTKVYIDPN